jgi:hypothetical protein
MVQTAKSLMSNDAPSWREVMSCHVGATCCAVWRPWTASGVGPLCVVVRDPLGEHAAQVPFAQRNDPVEACAPGGADDPLAALILTG